jgi:hypothetical protein
MRILLSLNLRNLRLSFGHIKETRAWSVITLSDFKATLPAEVVQCDQFGA